MSKPCLIAHRGLPKKYPENTLVGYEAAIAAGAGYLETDIQLTSDQIPVLFHDRDLKRLCNTDGAIHMRTLAELENIYAMDFNQFGYKFAKNPVATLDEFVELLLKHPHVKAFIEIKRTSIHHFGIAPVVAAILRSLRPVTRQCIIISYSVPVLLAVKNYGYPAIGGVTNKWSTRNNAKIADLKPDFLFCGINSLPRWGKLNLPDKKLVIFSTDEVSTANKLSSRGVEFIETDTIDDMLREMKQTPDSV